MSKSYKILMIILWSLVITSCSVKVTDNTYNKENEKDELYIAESIEAEDIFQLPDSIINEIEYSIDCEVIPSKPKFSITLYGYNVQGYGLTADKKNYYITKDINRISRITIVNEALDFYQELLFDETEIPNIESFPYGLTLDDWNFDGYQDISLWRFQGGTSLNVPTYYWLWDDEEKKFVRNEELTEISNYTAILIDKKAKQLEAIQRYSMGSHNYDYYEWIESELVFIKSVEVRWVFNEEDGSSGSVHIIKEIIDGELKIIDEYFEED